MVCWRCEVRAASKYCSRCLNWFCDEGCWALHNFHHNQGFSSAEIIVEQQLMHRSWAPDEMAVQ